MSNTTLSKLKAGSTREVMLPSVTQQLRDAGTITSEERVLVRIRRVRGSEIIAESGITPLLYGLARERRDGESAEAFQARLEAKLLEDPTKLLDSQRHTLAAQVAVVVLGVTGITITAGEDRAWDDVNLSSDGDATPDILGTDFAAVHDAIADFSSLPYQRLGGVGTTTFPTQQPSARGEQSSGSVRHDPEPVPG